jgi:putative endonuclease
VETAKIKGDRGEDLAARFLERGGYEIVARKWRTREGEIDIIAVKENFLVFAEVKTLKGGSFDGLERIIHTRKQKRIVETAKCFLAEHRQYNESYIRFDVLVVDTPGFLRVNHIENAFSELV